MLPCAPESDSGAPDYSGRRDGPFRALVTMLCGLRSLQWETESSEAHIRSPEPSKEKRISLTM